MSVSRRLSLDFGATEELEFVDKVSERRELLIEFQRAIKGSS